MPLNSAKDSNCSNDTLSLICQSLQCFCYFVFLRWIICSWWRIDRWGSKRSYDWKKHTSDGREDWHMAQHTFSRANITRETTRLRENPREDYCRIHSVSFKKKSSFVARDASMFVQAQGKARFQTPKWSIFVLTLSTLSLLLFSKNDFQMDDSLRWSSCPLRNIRLYSMKCDRLRWPRRQC